MFRTITALRRIWLAGLCVVIFMAVHAAGNEPAAVGTAADSVELSLKPLGSAEGDLPVGGPSGRTAVLRLNLPLIRRVVLRTDDLQAATLRISCQRVGPRFDPLAHGTANNGQSVRLADEPSLKEIRLQAGEELAIAAWKPDWHWNGGATLSGLSIARHSAGGPRTVVTLPAAMDQGVARTALGTLALVGLFSRDKFPVCEKRAAAKPESKPGDFTIAEGKGVGLRVDRGTLHLHTNGRASFDPGFGWAPAVLFTAAEEGTYTIEGRLDFQCAQPEHKVAWVAGRLTQPGGPIKGTTLAFHRLLREPSATLVAGTDYAAESLARVTIGRPGGEAVQLAGLAPALRNWASGAWEDHGLLVRAEKAGGASAPVLLAKGMEGTATIHRYPKHLLFDHPIKPQPGVYATIKDGRLYYGDQRLRLWSMVHDAPAARIRRLGFNCLRTWFQGDFYSDESAKKGEPMAFTPGDGSKLDRYDRMMADLKQNGIFVMLATTVGQGMPMKPLLADDSWIAGGPDWPQWKQAVNQAGGATYQLAYVDERLWKIRIRHAQNVFNHRNPYTGKRYAEEEIIALVEINNEAVVVKRWLEQGFDKWPAYFREKLQRQWNTWLAKRYKTDDALRAAWTKLEAQESPARGTVRLEPTLATFHAYPAARQRDFLVFLEDLYDARNQQYRDSCRSLAPKGVGVNVVPFSFDSQYQPSIPWLYTNWRGDTSTVSMYFWSNPTMLAAPPSLYVLDSHRLKDKLAVIYETQRGRPSPFRTEYPYMLAVMADWQDFDVVDWHGAWIGDRPDEQLLAGTADPPHPSHFWTGVHLEHDPAMSSAIAMAGRLFLAGHVGVAADPAVYTVGKEGIASYTAWNGLGGREMSLRTFTRGSRIEIVPQRDCGVLLDGKEPRPIDPPTAAIATGRHVLWDWPNQRLIVDAPGAKIYVGRTARSYRFQDGITLSGFNTPFVAFSLVSADGKPLLGAGACRKAYVSAVFDAKNTGLEFNAAVPGGPVEQARAVANRGAAPVVVDKVSYTLSFPVALDGRFTGYDFALRQVDETKFQNQNTLRRPEQTLWMGLLEIDRRGGAMAPIVDPSPGAVAAAAASAGKAAESAAAGLAGFAHPLPGLGWGDSCHRAYRLLREGSLR